MRGRSVVRAVVAATCLSGVVASGLPAAAAPRSGQARPRAEQAVALATPALRRMLAAHGSGPDHGFIAQRIEVDERGAAGVAVQQTYRGIPVWSGQAIVRVEPDGTETMLADAFLSGVAPTGAPVARITAARAVELAETAAGLRPGEAITPRSPDLWIYRHGMTDSLAWRVRLVHTDTGTPSIPVAFLDASSGARLGGYDDLQAATGTGSSFYSGTVSLSTTSSGTTYQLKDATRGNQQVLNLNHATVGAGTLFTDADNVWGDGTAGSSATAQQTAGVDAAYDAAATWDYFKVVHGRNGVLGNGQGVPSRVHYGNSYNRAFWDGTQVTYGDGGANAQPTTELDQGAHELTHGVIDTAVPGGLIYAGESGGLSEATADMFATAVEFYAANTHDPGDYLIGEEISGIPIRYMDKPSKDGLSKDCWYSGIGSLDVHYSSGPANHFFYLLSEGSGSKVINGVVYNSPTCNASTVAGIGRGKAEKIWYRALTTAFTSGETYAAARTATLNAAAALYGNGGTEFLATCSAWAAVGVGTACAPPTPLANNAPAANLGGAAGSSVLYTLSVPAGATNLTFTTSGGTGDVDLYVRFGQPPTTTAFDCRPNVRGNAETCAIPAPKAGTYYVLLRGYGAYSGVSLVGSFQPPTTALTNGSAVRNVAATSGSARYFTLVVPSGAKNLSFTTSGGNGEADLYVRIGAAPTTANYLCRPYKRGNSESCSFASPRSGTYYVMVAARVSFSGVSVIGSYTP